MADTPDLIVADAAAWRDFLAANADTHDAVRLLLAKKGTTEPTSLSYAQALDEALCWGWIDGQVNRHDDATYWQRFTPRRRRSLWSQRNIGLTERLIAEGRMQPRGLAEIERAQTDGRWAAAYAGPATIQVPEELAQALAAQPAALAAFEELTSQNRYAILHRLTILKRPETRTRRIAETIEMLLRGETHHPQQRQL